MDYSRKKHWVKYRSAKCKMYLRNDFHFECAYCGLKEKDNLIGEECFEKDHFVPMTSSAEEDLDDYQNMVYSCRRCNRTKTDQELKLILDPCKDNIYRGSKPHIKKTGPEGNYRLLAVTKQGEEFINSLQLNSRFYRNMRRCQDEQNQIMKEICRLAEEEQSKLFESAAIIKRYLENNNSMMNTDEFRCGNSKGGKDLYSVLLKLRKKGIGYSLLFDEDDLDICLSFEGSTYYCEVRTSDYEGDDRRGPRLNKNKKEAWLNTGKQCGVLYYYKETDILELYVFQQTTVKKYILS